MAWQTNSISQAIVCDHCKGLGYLQRRLDLFTPPKLNGDAHFSQREEAIVHEPCSACQGYGRFYQCPICLGRKIVTYRPDYGAPQNSSPTGRFGTCSQPHHSYECNGCDGKGVVIPPRLAALKNLQIPGRTP